MKSPFPGMDPYLEAHWGDVHTRLIVYISDQINDRLPPDLQARVEESVTIDAGDSHRTVFPDVRVVEQPRTPSPSSSSSVGDIAVAEPLLVPLPDEQPTLRHIEIVDRSSGQRIVTAIELLSPKNKVGEIGRRAYREKQQQYLRGEVNLVEIDLIREGQFIVAAPEQNVPPDRRSPYIVCIRRANNPLTAEVFPINLREPLPNFRIPLRLTDSDVVLQLQPLLEECYRRGRYSAIDYTQRTVPPLSEEDVNWADALLREKGYR